MFFFRINKIRIVDNHKWSFPLFGSDQIDLQLLSFVTTANEPLPDVQAFMTTTDPDKKTDIVKNWVQQTAASRILTPIARVTDNFTATFGDAGYALYQADAIPDNFNWEFIAVKLNDNTRAFGKKLDGIAQSDGIGDLGDNLAKLLGGAANASFVAGVEVGKFVVNTVASWLEQTPDDELGLYYGSLNRVQHYPFGERKKDDVVDLTGNMFVDYSIFGF